MRERLAGLLKNRISGSLLDQLSNRFETAGGRVSKTAKSDWYISLDDSLSRVRNRLPSSKGLVLGGSIAIVAYLVLLPVVFLIWTSFWSGYPGQFGASFTVANYIAVYTSMETFVLFFNSVIVAVGVTFVAGFFGLLFAWLFARTNLPTKGSLELVILAPYAVPSFVFAMMYISTFGPNMGLITTLTMDLFGLQSPPFDVYSPHWIVLIVGINSTTTFYLLTVPALQDMNASFEEVSRICGANTFEMIRHVTFPLIKPAILSAILLTFIISLGEFAVVAILGAPQQFHVYATKIWLAVTGTAPPQYGAAAALSMSLLLVTAVLVWYYRKVTARTKDFMTVTGEGYNPHQWDLGKWRWPLAGSLWVILLVFWILPMAVMILVSIHQPWLGTINLEALTFNHYVEVLTDEMVRRAFRNSLVIGVSGAVLGTCLVSALAYFTERTDYRFRGVADFLSLTPLAIPSIILGAAVLFTYLWIGRIHRFFDIYGTIWIIMIGSVIVFIPVTSRIAIGNIVQIHHELEESARVFGATWFQQIREVFLPLFKTTVGIIWFYLFIHIFRLLTVPIMTYRRGTETVSIVIFNQWVNHAALEFVSALSVVFVGVMLVTVVGLRLFGIRFYQLR